MSDLVTSIIRTVIPYMVGALGSFFATNEVMLSANDLSALTSVLTVVFGGLYYIVARLVERRWPEFGWLLGSPKKPEYK